MYIKKNNIHNTQYWVFIRHYRNRIILDQKHEQQFQCDVNNYELY